MLHSVVAQAEGVAWREDHMAQRVQKLLQWVNSQRVHHECRRCGTTVDGTTDECPACGSTRIARYEIG
jgi:hypothetical protein